MGFVDMVGSVWAIGEWAESHWIIGVIRFQKIYGLYGLNILPSDLNGPSVEKLEL